MNAHTLSAQEKAMRLTSLITVINVSVASGFSIAGLLAPKILLPIGDTPTDASLIFAMYAAARTLPLALAVFVAIYRRSVSALIILGALAGLIQLIDVGVGIFVKDIGKAVGPLMIAILQFYAVLKLKSTTMTLTGKVDPMNLPEL